MLNPIVRWRSGSPLMILSSITSRLSRRFLRCASSFMFSLEAIWWFHLKHIVQVYKYFVSLETLDRFRLKHSSGEESTKKYVHLVSSSVLLFSFPVSCSFLSASLTVSSHGVVLLDRACSMTCSSVVPSVRARRSVSSSSIRSLPGSVGVVAMIPPPVVMMSGSVSIPACFQSLDCLVGSSSEYWCHALPVASLMGVPVNARSVSSFHVKLGPHAMAMCASLLYPSHFQNQFLSVLFLAGSATVTFRNRYIKCAYDLVP